jgi:hypothetical protein
LPFHALSEVEGPLVANPQLAHLESINGFEV